MAAFQRDAAARGGGDAPKEPSARARMVAERLRAEDEAAARGEQGSRRGWPLGRKKRGRERARPATPPGWRTGPAWQEMNGTRDRRRRTVRSVVGVVLAVLAAVLVVRPSLIVDRLPGGEAKAAGAPSPLPAETALPSQGPGGGTTPGRPPPSTPSSVRPPAAGPTAPTPSSCRPPRPSAP
ncbi:hypothetical protein [Streptomyces sp. L2]|uniref:hypothetical protein n=1 Tax=Streptomyces sp. L2 TaxID=2162665 RepID=UPI00322035A1